MRPATPTSDPMTLAPDASHSSRPRAAAWLLAGAAALVVARLAGGAVVSRRCVSAAQAMPVRTAQGISSVGRELEQLAPSGRWESGARAADGSRVVAYRAGQGTTIDWEWSCRDEETVPSFVALSPHAKELTPERAFK